MRAEITPMHRHRSASLSLWQTKEGRPTGKHLVGVVEVNVNDHLSRIDDVYPQRGRAE
jgi:hypothetical protein